MPKTALILLMISLLCPAAPAAAMPAGEVDATRFGATPDDGVDDRHGIQQAIDASLPGQTVRFPSGVFDCSDTLYLRSNRTYRGTGQTVLRFNSLPRDTYGVAFLPNCTDVTFSGFRLVGGGIKLSDGERYRDIRITHNRITGTADTPGVYISIPSERLVIEHNRFHDYDHYGVIAYHIDRASVSRNVFSNIVQGAHLLAPKNDCTFSFNYGRGLTRMGLEVQRMGDVIAVNTTVEGNVFHDWKLPFRDSFGLSIVPDESINTRIINNYLCASFSGPWNAETRTGGQGERFGYGIEAGFASGVVEGNVVGGPWANHIVASHPDTLVTNNRLYGKPVWQKHLAGEPGPGGFGSVVSKNNRVELNMKKMPPPPAVEAVIAAGLDPLERSE
jgi:hypothetical protein